MLLGGGIVGTLVVVVLVLARFGALGAAWRGTNQWSAITDAIKRQPELVSIGWLPPKNRSIRYVVGSEPNDVIDATIDSWRPAPAQIAARSQLAASVLRRAVDEACGNGAPAGVTISYPD